MELIFKQGFSGVESAQGRYWRWSDGAGGTGVVDLLNHTGTPRTIRFHVIIRSGGTVPVLFDLLVQGRQETISLFPDAVFDRILTVNPGSNEISIHSHGPRIVAPNDPRYLVFGLEGWTVSPAGK